MKEILYYLSKNEEFKNMKEESKTSLKTLKTSGSNSERLISGGVFIEEGIIRGGRHSGKKLFLD